MSGVPHDGDLHAVVGVPQPITHAADIAPRLAWHQFLGAFTKSMGGLTHPFNATLNGIAYRFVLFERLTIHTSEVARDTLGVFDDVVKAVRWIVPRRQ